MKITDLKPKKNLITFKHPRTGEELKTDNGHPVAWEVVGRDSKEYFEYQREFFKKIRDLHANSGLDAKEDLPKDVMDNAILDNVACCVVGWDENINDFFAPLDTKKGGGKYSKRLVIKILGDAELQWLRDQLDEFIEDRSNFFDE